MRLTTFTDYALRILLYTSANNPRLVTSAEIQENYNISRGHVMKIVRLLAGEGYLKASRGRSGGLCLGKRPDQITVGEIVRLTEPDFKLVECFGADNMCLISEHCKMPRPFNDALNAFLAILDGYTLADLALPNTAFGVPPEKALPARGPIWEPIVKSGRP